MKRIIHAGRTYIVSNRYADELVGYLAEQVRIDKQRPEFFGFHYYREDAQMAITIDAQVRISPTDPIVVESTDAHSSWDEPDGTADELYYLTAWKGDEHMYQGE